MAHSRHLSAKPWPQVDIPDMSEEKYNQDIKILSEETCYTVKEVEYVAVRSSFIKSREIVYKWHF